MHKNESMTPQIKSIEVQLHTVTLVILRTVEIIDTIRGFM